MDRKRLGKRQGGAVTIPAKALGKRRCLAMYLSSLASAAIFHGAGACRQRKCNCSALPFSEPFFMTFRRKYFVFSGAALNRASFFGKIIW